MKIDRAALRELANEATAKRLGDVQSTVTAEHVKSRDHTTAVGKQVENVVVQQAGATRVASAQQTLQLREAIDEQGSTTKLTVKQGFVDQDKRFEALREEQKQRDEERDAKFDGKLVLDESKLKSMLDRSSKKAVKEALEEKEREDKERALDSLMTNNLKSFQDTEKSAASTASSTNAGTLGVTSIEVWAKENEKPNTRGKSEAVKNIEEEKRAVEVQLRKAEQEKESAEKKLEISEDEKKRLEREARGKTRPEKIEETKPAKTPSTRKMKEAAATHKKRQVNGRKQSKFKKASNPFS